MTLYTDAFGPNVQNILCNGSRVITARVPAQVRKELMTAVKAGVLRRLPKDGLLPEVFYNPNNQMSAIERRKREAEYAISCIAKVMATPDDYKADREALERKIFG
jgi:hypothetical protein